MRSRNARGFSKVLFSQTSFAWSLNDNGVFALRSALCQLIKSENFTTGLQDANACGLSNVQSGNLKIRIKLSLKTAYCDLRNVDQTLVVSDCANNNDDLVFISLALLLVSKTLQRNWWAKTTGHKKTLQDDLVELLFCFTSQVGVDLNKKLQNTEFGLPFRGRARKDHRFLAHDEQPCDRTCG